MIVALISSCITTGEKVYKYFPIVIDKTPNIINNSIETKTLECLNEPKQITATLE